MVKLYILWHVSSWLPLPVQIVNISTRVSVLSKKIMWHPNFLKEGSSCILFCNQVTYIEITHDLIWSYS